MDASVSGGSGVPALSITSTPACWTSQVNSTPVASSTRRVASVSSGPVPSPGTRVTTCGMRGTIVDTASRRLLRYRRGQTSGLDEKEWDERVQAGSRGRRRRRDGDRRARPGRRRAPLPRRRHRGARRALPVRERLGPPRRRRPLVDDARAGAVRAGAPDRQRAGRPPGRDGAPRRRVEARQAQRDLRRAGADRPRPDLRADDVHRRALRAGGRRQDRRRPGRRRRAGPDRRREVPPSLARRGRSAPRQGDRHVLDLHRRARPERIDLRRARRRVDRRGLRRRALLGRRRALRARCTAARRRTSSRCSRRSPRWATPSAG